MRHYSPQLGRFLQPDPAGIAGGINLYAYSNNNPLRYFDPWGLWPAPDASGGDDGEYGEADPQNEKTQKTKTQEADRLRLASEYGRELIERVRSGEISDLEAAALLVDFVSQFHTDMESRSGLFGINRRVVDDVDGYMSDLNALLTGRTHGGEYYIPFGDSGFSPSLIDGSPQVRHFGGALQAGYDYGFIAGNVLAFGREISALGSPAFSTADLRLNALGVSAGDSISGLVGNLGDWM